MALPKEVRYVVVLLVMCCSLEIYGRSEQFDVCLKKMTSANASHIHAREKRETVLLQVVMQLSDLEIIQELFDSTSFPVVLNSTALITNVNVTTVCLSKMSGYECRCEKGFAWSESNCITHGACDATIDETCRCINGLPDDGQQCEPTANTTDEDRTLTLSMDITFTTSFNDQNNSVYKNTARVITQQCEKHISNLRAASIKGFRKGSTIVEYVITAPSLQDEEISAAELGILTEMAKIYPMLAEGEALLSDPSEIFFGIRVIMTCGPPKDYLNFSPSLSAEWRRDGVLIPGDEQHSFSIQNRKAILTISNFYNTDNGIYECRIKDESLAPNITWRQTSKFTVNNTPLIQVTPVMRKVACEVGKGVKLSCSVNKPYMVEFKDRPEAGSEISDQYTIDNCENTEQKFTCQVKSHPQFNREITLVLARQNFVCFNDIVFGDGLANDEAIGPCEVNEVGERTAVCRTNGTWEVIRENCILQQIHDLLMQSESLNNNSLPGFLRELRSVSVNFTEEVAKSPSNINAIVDILNNVANATSALVITINKTPMADILITIGVLTIDKAKDSWDFLNANDTGTMFESKTSISSVESVSSRLLLSVEIVTTGLVNDSFNIDTPLIILNKTRFKENFTADFNSSVEIDIPESDGGTKSLTVITFESMDNILPPRDDVNSSSNVINGRVVLVQSSGNVNNVSFTFDILNDTLGNPQCVFWNFSLFNGLGGWDNEGCVLVENINETVTCSCNHLTSFSILMSPFSPDDLALDIITYIGVGISLASLVICLIIEAVIWRKIRKNTTSYLRHVSIVNIAVSLLIANIWFIIGAAISDAEQKNGPACTAATFFIHFFYLALFFWMLSSALLLLYRTLSVFDGGLSKNCMLAIGFSLGYGAPLIIAVVTIAVTAPSEAYIQGTDVCWLNWERSKALLAFVIPALLIVLINLVILVVVLYKMLRRRTVADAARAAERHALVVIARTLAFLTPFFGLTWGLGVGIMVNPYNKGIHITFAFFNSLQGFFILLFGTLLDKKVQSELAIKSQTSKSGTGSTSAGDSSSSGLGFFRKWRRGRDVYNTSSSGASNSFTNT